MQRFASVVIAFLLSYASAPAQTHTIPSTAASGPGVFGILGLPGVKGAPFSADVITTVDRTLTDGNRIQQESKSRVFRDSEGRVRREYTSKRDDGSEFTRAEIDDPVKGAHILLNSAEKVATVSFRSQRLPLASPPAGSTNISASKGAAQQKLMGDDLGEKTIEGFVVHGARMTHTIPAGKIGNEQPIVRTSERWYSSELKADLLTDVDDPQSSHRITQLVNIQAGDPDPSLFQVPPGYTVRELETKVKETTAPQEPCCEP